MEDPRTHPNWERFREYATHVRKIRIGPCVNPFEDRPSIWAQFQEFILDEPMLPLLRCVDITGDRVRTPHTIPLLLISPSVREMNIWLKVVNVNELDDTRNTVSEACARAPHLETISLAIKPWIVDLSVLHCNPHLRSISIRERVTIGDLEPLTHLAELEHLDVMFGDTGDHFPALYFPSLRHLSVRGVWEDSIRHFMELVEGPHIHSLRLHASHDDPTQVINIDPRQLIHQSRTCLQIIATRLSTLETLSVVCARSTARSPWDLSPALDTEGALMAIVEPLLSLRGLRHITLDFQPFILRLASDDLRRLAEAWMNLEELRVDITAVDSGRAGFESIVHFARCCPRLRVLRLPTMDLAIGAFQREGLEYPVEPHPLRDLDVKEVVFPREADLSYEMAEFIQRVFPNTAIPFVNHPIVVTDEESGDRSRLV